MVDRKHGIHYYADDLVIISIKYNDIQDKTSRLIYTIYTGLTIIVIKTVRIRLNEKMNEFNNLNNTEVKMVEHSFTWVPK